jgi:DNA polymerase-3 subunit alpha/error-prone DNA polymerase
MGLTVLPPDVNESDVRWKGKDDAIRVGWLSIKGLSSQTQAKIIAARRKRPYRSLADFLQRIRPAEPEARALIHAGAFDRLHPDQSRAALLWELAAWHRSRTGRARTGDLFAPPPAPAALKPAFPPGDRRQRLRREFAVLGFLCDRHPMHLFADALKGRGIVKACDLNKFVGRHVRVAGMLITGKITHTKHGDPMEFLTFEDATGLVETTFFPQAYRKFCYMLERTRPYILYGKVDEDFGAVTLTVERLARL